MSPEIHARRPYVGASVDLFAAAIILFIMYTQHPPFTRAEPTDPFYKLICANRADLFWKAHSKNKPRPDYFSDDFKNLVTALIQFDPATRPQMADVLNHPWVQNNDCATLEEIQFNFAQRKALIDAENEAKRKQKEMQRMQASHGGPATRKQYRTVGAAKREVNDTNIEESKHELRNADKYIPGVKSNTSFFSTLSPAELLGEINGYIKDHSGQSNVDPNKFKLKAQLKYVPESEEDEDEKMEDDEENSNEGGEDGEEKVEDKSMLVDFAVKILQVGDSDKYCVEFHNVQGNKLMFYQVVQKLRDDLADLANATD